MYYQPPSQQVYVAEGSRYSGCLKLFLYAVSLLVPLVGVIMGLVYLSRPDPESKKLGQICLILGIISFVVTCCLGAILGLSPLLALPFLEGLNY
ncbi:MAG: hypothetical protein PVI59_14670 [Anaerolineae bacterium]